MENAEIDHNCKKLSVMFLSADSANKIAMQLDTRTAAK